MYIQTSLLVFLNLIVTKKLKIGIWGLVYLCLTPFLVWGFWNPQMLFAGIILGLVVFAESPFVYLILGTLWLISVRLGIHPTYPIHVINQLYGEHQQIGLLPKLLHNKTELFYFWLKNVEEYFGLTKFYIQAHWSHVSPYYLLGCFYPWEIFVHILVLRKWLKKPRISLMQLTWMTSGLLFLGLDPHSVFAQIFLYSFLYWLALKSLTQLKTMTIQVWLMILVFSFWAFQFSVITNFIRP